MLLLNWKTALATALCASRLGVAQVAPPTVLEVQAENFVAYVGDVSDVLTFATDPDGTPVGNIYAAGFSGGAPPPGAPLAVAGSNNAVVGGTGAFVGVRGQLGG